MELTSKQRALLRRYGHDEPIALHIGKGDISENMIKQGLDAIKARELLKVRVLDSSSFASREAARELSERLGAEIIETRGKTVLLFKRNEEEPRFHL